MKKLPSGLSYMSQDLQLAHKINEIVEWINKEEKTRKNILKMIDEIPPYNKKRKNR